MGDDHSADRDAEHQDRLLTACFSPWRWSSVSSRWSRCWPARTFRRHLLVAEDDGRLAVAIALVVLVLGVLLLFVLSFLPGRQPSGQGTDVTQTSEGPGGELDTTEPPPIARAAQGVR